MNLKGMDVSNPGAFVSMIILVLIGVEMVKIGLPLIIDGLLSLANVPNFSFASFFASNGLVSLIVSAVILIGVLSLLGLKMKSSKR